MRNDWVSYGHVEALAAPGTITLASKGENGELVVDPLTAGPCAVTDGP